MKHVKQLIMMFLMIHIIAVCAYAGDLEPPPGTPGSTMKTLDEIPPSWHQILSSSERFKDVMGGEAVLDKETGLVWAKNANLDGAKTWNNAYIYIGNLTIGNRKGWRLPTREELSSLLDMSIPGEFQIQPGVFTSVQSGLYWSGTTYALYSAHAWIVAMDSGYVGNRDKTDTNYVWPVRGGND